MNEFKKKWARFRQSKHFLKVASFCLSIFLWFYVLNSQPVEIKRLIKINYIYPPDMIFSEFPVTEVEAVYRGPRSYARGGKLEGKVINIDLSKYGRAQRQRIDLVINENEIPLSFGLALERFSPQKIVGTLERKIYKNIPIVVDFQGKVRPSMELVDHMVRPKKIQISGPKSVIRKFSKVKTAPVYLNELEGKGQREVYLQELPSVINFERGLDKVELLTEVRLLREKEFIRDFRIRFLSSNRVFKSSAEYAKVKFTALPEEVNDKMLQRFTVVADIPESSKKKMLVVPLEVKVPKNVRLLTVGPSKIKIWPQ